MDSDPYRHPELSERRPTVQQRRPGRSNSMIISDLSKGSGDNVKLFEALLELSTDQGYFEHDVKNVLKRWTLDPASDPHQARNGAIMLAVLQLSESSQVPLSRKLEAVLEKFANEQDAPVQKKEAPVKEAPPVSTATSVPKPQGLDQATKQPEITSAPVPLRGTVDEDFLRIKSDLITALVCYQKKWNGHKARIPTLLEAIRATQTTKQLLQCIQTQIKIHRNEPTGIDPNLGRHLVPMKRPDLHGKFWKILHEYQALLEGTKPEEQTRPKKRFFIC